MATERKNAVIALEMPPGLDLLRDPNIEKQGAPPHDDVQIRHVITPVMICLETVMAANCTGVPSDWEGPSFHLTTEYHKHSLPTAP